MGFELLAGRAGEERPGARKLALGAAGLVAVATIGFLGWRGPAAFGLLLLVGEPRVGGAGRALARGAVLVLVVADLALATGPYGSLRDFPTGWTRVFHSHGSTLMDGEELAALGEELAGGRFAWVGGSRRKAAVLPQNSAGPLGGVPRLSCYEVLLPRAWGDLHAKLGLPRFPGAVMYNLDPDQHGHVYDLASVSRIAQVHPSDPALRWGSRAAAAEHRDEHFREGRGPSPWLPTGVVVRVTANDDALPRAYFVGGYQLASAEEALDRVASGDLDYHHAVLLEREPDPGVASRPGPIRAARLRVDEPERVVVQVDAPAAGFLVLTDSHYPGWRAVVDEQPAEILRANGLHRAVRVPEGQHEVRFVYRPRSLRVGAWLSLASLFCVVAVPAAARSVRARRAKP